MERPPTSSTGSSSSDACEVCDSSPVVLVALRHRVMRRLTHELLGAEHGCWTVTQPWRGELLADAIARTHPDLVVVDDVDVPACCQAALAALPPARVIVIGPEPDAAYRSLALNRGAAGWICRDHVAEELSGAMRAALGCHHGPCPPSTPPAALAGDHLSRRGGVRP